MSAGIQTLVLEPWKSPRNSSLFGVTCILSKESMMNGKALVVVAAATAVAAADPAESRRGSQAPDPCVQARPFVMSSAEILDAFPDPELHAIGTIGHLFNLRARCQRSA